MLRASLPSGLAIVLAIAAVGCPRKAPSDGAPPQAAATPEPTASAAQKAVRAVALEPIRRLDDCALGHRGVLLDFGDPSMRSHYTGKLDAPEPESVEHEGATWARVTSRTLSTEFYWSGDIEKRAEPQSADAGVSTDSGAYVEVRVRALAARSVAAYLNGKVLNGKTLQRGETQVVLLRGGPGPILPGPNELVLRFNGGGKNETEGLAEVDWVHVGSGEITEPYSAPTRADALVHATIDGVSKKALSLRAPGYVRCTGWIPGGASVEATVAVAGPGEADAEVRLLKDRAQPIVLGTVHASGGASGKWMNISVPVGDVGSGTLGAIEIAPARTTAKGARVLVADPRVVGPALPPPGTVQVPSRGVVVIVLGSISPKSLAPYGGPRAVTEITELAKRGATFEAHRATASVASGALASMLTGLGARAHTVEDPDARLPKALTTVADAAKQAGVATALFTANPTTGPAFGFDRGWDTYAAHAPNDETPSTLVFDEASRWIEGHRDARFLVVIHARGGHPPWDVPTEDLKALAPVDYQGQFDPKRAAESLARAKKFPTRFSEGDRTRVWALYAHGIEEHDAAVGRLMTALRAAGRDTDTTVILTGDVSVNESSSIPFVDTESLDENILAVPLIVRPPGGQLAGKRVTAPTSSADLARTILTALALASPASFQGVDLFSLASGETLLAERPLIATTGSRFAARWGSFVLSGTREREMKLCDLLLEPTCNIDVRKTYPLALEAMHRFAFETMGPGARVEGGTRVGREPAFIDPATMAGLLSWGRPPEKRKKGERE